MAKSVYKLSSFKAGELSPRLSGRTDVEYFSSGCETLENMIIYPQGGATKRSGTLFLSSAANSAKPVRLVEFIYNEDQAYILEMGHEYMRFYWSGARIQTASGTAYQIATPYDGDDVFDLKFAQIVDTVYFTHPDYPPYILSRLDHDEWTLEDIDEYGGPFLDQNTTSTTIEPSARTGSITISGSADVFYEYHEGALFKLADSEVERAEIKNENTFTDAIELDRGDSFVMSLTGNWADVGTGTATLQKSFDQGANYIDYATSTANSTLEITEVEDDIFYRVGVKYGDFTTTGTLDARLTKRNQAGWAEIDTYRGSKFVEATVKVKLPSTDAITTWSEGSWSDFNSYPAAVCFSKQRSIFAGTEYQPTTFWGSNLDDYTNFDVGDGTDDDAFGFTIASNDVNAIRALVDTRVLLAFTDAGVWKLSRIDQTITPTSPTVDKQTSYGSANIQPIIIGNAVVYIQSGGHKIRVLAYDFQVDGWISNEISDRAEHLLRPGVIVDIAYAAKPDNLIYLVLDTGDIIACTFDTENKVIAFGKITTTNGSFESVATIPGTDRDEVWVVVKRTIAGNDYRYIEQFHTPFWTEQTEYIYMDSALTYTGPPKTTLSGLDHLEGEEVAVCVDGAMHINCTVSNGIINLQSGYEGVGATAIVHVGKIYNGDLGSMRLNPPTEIGSSLGKQQVIYDVNLLLQNTINLKLGKDADNLQTLDSLAQRTMSRAVPPFSGAHNETYPYGIADELYVYLRSDTCLPFTCLGIATTVYASAR